MLDMPDNRPDRFIEPMPAEAVISEPALVEPTTALGAFLRHLGSTSSDQVASTLDSWLRGEVSLSERESLISGDTPFLSVLVRTQGKRPATFPETLLTLAAQTCDDFEVLVMAHDIEPSLLQTTTDTVTEFHNSFARRVRIVPVAGGGRARPLNVGAVEARGRYLATLDDDDVVLAHWVEELKAAAQRAPGRIVHIGVASQEVMASPKLWLGQDGYRVTRSAWMNHPLEFDFLSHLRDNFTPNNGYAIPRFVVVGLEQWWDEGLPVLEDWDQLLRTACICGVESCRTIGALLRWWVSGEDSKSTHPPAVWDQARQTIIDKLDSTPLLLDAGAVSRLRSLLYGQVELDATRDALFVNEAALAETRLGLSQAHEALDEARHELSNIFGSKSWKLVAILRRTVGLIRRISLVYPDQNSR